MLYIFVGIILMIVFVLSLFFFLGNFSITLQLFLLGSSWKTFEECRKQGFTEFLLRALLHAYYLRGILEVQLDKHVYGCADCKNSIYVLYRIRTLDQSIDNGVIVIIEVKYEDIPFKYFEANMFNADTADFFEFRLKKGSGGRRWGKKETKVSLPNFGKLKPT